MRRPRPGPCQVSQAEEALLWLCKLSRTSVFLRQVLWGAARSRCERTALNFHRSFFSVRKALYHLVRRSRSILCLQSQVF